MSNNSEFLMMAKRGRNLAFLIATLTFITFLFAIIAVPPCGPYCQENCIGYPYLDTIGQYPKDFLWIWLALIQLIVFVLFLVFLHQYASDKQKLFTLPGLIFGSIASAILLMTYYTQVSVLQISLLKEEYDGLALFTMNNEHGIFIAREEIAYLLMSLSLFLFSWIFERERKRGLILRWMLKLPFIASILSLIIISIMHGLDRSYRFEVVTISANWLIIIISGYTMAGWFKSTSK